MTLQATQIAERFVRLAPEQRRAFLAKLAENGIDFSALPIVPAADRTAAPLSAAQRGLWLTWQREPKSPAYNLTGIVAVEGALDPDLLQGALDDLVARHESLRTTFFLDADGEPRQRVHPAARVPIRQREGLDVEESDARARALARDPFDLEAGPLLRVELHRLDPQASRIVIGLHHIVADGGSVALILRDLDALYTARRAGTADGLPPLSVQYADYALWQRGRMEAGEAERQAAFWHEELGPEDARTPLPLDRPRGRSRAEAGGHHDLALTPQASAALRTLARTAGATPFTAVVAAFALTLARLGEGADVRLGMPLADRTRPETQPMVGHLTNVAVLRARIDQRASFKTLLAQVRDRVLAAQGHIDLPFDAVVEAVAPAREPGLHPLFQVKVTEQAARPGESRFAGMPMRLSGVEAGEVHFDLSLDLTDAPDGLRCRLAYARDLFDAETIAGLARTLAGIVDAVIAAPDRPLLTVGVSAPEPAPEPEPAEDVVAAWRARAVEAPDAVSLRQGAHGYTRAQVEAASDRLAAELAALGAGPEQRVALHLGRSPEWVLGLLAILKAGAAYVPVDPELPRARRAALVAESGARVVVADADLGEDFGCRVLRATFAGEAVAASGAFPEAQPPQAAYVLYTSGSTGTPKGVVVTRGGLAQYVAGIRERLGLVPGMRLAMVSTVAADLGNTVLFGALAAGAELHLFDRATAFDPDRFAAAMREARIEGLKIVPSHLGALLQAGTPADALPDKLLVCGGEALRWPLAQRVAELKPKCRMVNHYGPTEATVGALCQDAAEAMRGGESVPIGTPLAGVRALVLDGVLNPVPVGGTGELYLGGPGLARGYLAEGALTAERFVPDPYGGAGARLYRTGDRVRCLRDGSTAFLGRADDQVKIRGHRVEPGEVAAALRALPGVRDAAVVAVGEERARLAGYVVAEAGTDLAALEADLSARLPDALVPASLTRLDALPLTPNGKLDRRALPAPVEDAPAKAEPAAGAEQALAALWADLLGIDVARIGREDAFAALGGDSILSLKMLARIRKQGLAGGQKLSLADILNAKDLAALAARIAPQAAAGPDVVHLRRGGTRVPLYCVPGLIANATEFAGLATRLGPERTVEGFVSHVYTEGRWRGYDVAALSAAYAEHIARTEAGGRCALIGWSSGGDLAFETARRLAGRVEVAFLGLVDVFESVPFAAPRPLDAAQRAEGAARLAVWLARSAMAAEWRALIAGMDETEREALDAALLDQPEEPPVDGPDIASREFETWALLDKRVRAKRHAFAPLSHPVHVWQAQDSLTRQERLRDWSLLAPVAATTEVAGAHHLDILQDAAFQESVARVLDAVG